MTRRKGREDGLLQKAEGLEEDLEGKDGELKELEEKVKELEMEKGLMRVKHGQEVTNFEVKLR